jgi:hypothetical protein
MERRWGRFAQQHHFLSPARAAWKVIAGLAIEIR